jgi:hypothetical protein
MIRLEKRVKNILRFKTTIGCVTLKDAITELTQEQFDAVKAHPSFAAYTKTSGIRIASEEIVSAPKAPAKKDPAPKANKPADGGENTPEGNDPLDLIDPSKFNKEELVKMATDLEIEVGEMTKAQLAEAISAKKSA